MKTQPGSASFADSQGSQDHIQKLPPSTHREQSCPHLDSCPARPALESPAYNHGMIHPINLCFVNHSLWYFIEQVENRVPYCSADFYISISSPPTCSNNLSLCKPRALHWDGGLAPQGHLAMSGDIFIWYTALVYSSQSPVSRSCWTLPKTKKCFCPVLQSCNPNT